LSPASRVTEDLLGAAGGISGRKSNPTEQMIFQSCRCRPDLYPAFAESLKEETGIDIELDLTGTLCLGFTEKDEAEPDLGFDWQSKAGLSVEWLSGDDSAPA